MFGHRRGGLRRVRRRVLAELAPGSPRSSPSRWSGRRGRCPRAGTAGPSGTCGRVRSCAAARTGTCRGWPWPSPAAPAGWPAARRPWPGRTPAAARRASRPARCPGPGPASPWTPRPAGSSPSGSGRTCRSTASAVYQSCFWMPAARPSVPVSTRWICTFPPCCCACTFGASSGAVPVLVVMPETISGCWALNASRIGLTSCRVPGDVQDVQGHRLATGRSRPACSAARPWRSARAAGRAARGQERDGGRASREERSRARREMVSLRTDIGVSFA